MNRDVIKYIAIITMTLNHISSIFLDPDTLLGEALLDIGYFTAVTMCYFLVEGYHYTHSKKKYGQRLLVFALISQIPFQEAVGAAAFNMLFTLFFLLSDPLCQGVYQKAGRTDCGDHLSCGLHPVRGLGASCGSLYPAF